MRKTKISLFFVPLSVITLAFCFSVVLAKSENANGASRGNSPSPSASASVGASVPPSVSLNKGQINAQEHRSAVANFVQALVRVADRDGGIGEQVRVIAQQQNQSEVTTTAAMERIQTRSKVKAFFIGTDYKNTGQLRSEMVQTRNRIEQLTRLTEQAKSAEDKATLQTQIQTLEQEQTKLDNFLKANESKFSLFGWLVKLFNE